MAARFSAADDTAAPAEDSPLLLAVSRALQALLRKAASLHQLTETASEVDAFCSTVEAVLQHRFKSRQFYMFTCHPWSLIEASESWGDLEAESVRLAREVGSSDAARLRAWLFVQLNQRSLQLSLGAVLDDDNLRATFSTTARSCSASIAASCSSTSSAHSAASAFDWARPPASRQSPSSPTLPSCRMHRPLRRSTQRSGTRNRQHRCPWRRRPL